MKPSNPENSQPKKLADHWPLIESSRSLMAKQIHSLADTLSGARQRQLRSVGRWLEGTDDYEAALERPDVLYFCRAWLDVSLGRPNQEPLTKSEMITAVGKGYCKFETSAPSPRNLTPFLYPMLAMLAWLVMVTVGSIFLLPEFKQMFDEFGIEVPASTRSVFWLGSWFEANWIGFFAVLFLVPILLIVFIRLSQRGRAYSLSWFDRRFSRVRIQLSVWASHVASLLAAGVSDSEAILIAGRCSTNSQLRENCVAFVKGNRTDLINPDTFPLINNSLSLTDNAAKIAILEETGRYYRAVSQTVQSWWLSLLSKAIIVLIYATLAFVFVSVYKPVISIISGLTSW